MFREEEAKEKKDFVKNDYKGLIGSKRHLIISLRDLDLLLRAGAVYWLAGYEACKKPLLQIFLLSRENKNYETVDLIWLKAGFFEFVEYLIKWAVRGSWRLLLYRADICIHLEWEMLYLSEKS